MDNVTVDKLRRIHGDKAEEVFGEIASLGGFGEPTRDHTGGLDPSYAGGLDLTGVLDPANKDITEAKKNKIRELVSDSPAKKEAKEK